MGSLLPVLGYGAIPVAAATLGGALTAWRTPGERVQGMVQHFAAGVAFGLVALLCLVTEELQVEAHEKPGTPLAAAVFFVGFFPLVVLDEAIR